MGDIKVVDYINIIAINNMDKEELIGRLKAEGFSLKVTKAFRMVKRENFIPENLRYLAYEDIALPLERGATISQPYTIAFMLELLELKDGKNQKVLEIGSGSGYVLALISKIIKKGKIYGIEIIENLARKSRETLKRNARIKIYNMNGFLGLLDKAPFDRILISAAVDRIPEHLYSQLKDDGILVVPVRDSIFKIKKFKGKIKIEEFPGFVFVPLQR